MALNTRISAAAAIAACNAIVDLIDTGSSASAGILRIYTGTQPADPDAAATGTMLAEISLNNPAFGAAADVSPGGRATADVDPALTENADETGTAGWFRVFNRDGVAIMDGECGTSGADLNLVTTSLVTGQPVEITSWTVTMPQS